MGLEIVAYSYLKPVAHGAIGKGNLPFRVSAARSRAPELELGRDYDYDQRLSFYSSGYSGYGRFREALANLAGIPRDWAQRADLSAFQTHAFYELLDFSECEGTIGSEACRQLLGDFVQHEPLIGDETTFPAQFIDAYYAFMDGLELAANDGAISLQ